MTIISRLTMLLLLTLAWTLVPAIPSRAAKTAYVDPALTAAQGETISIIVTAHNSRQAAAAVLGLGGKVSSDLWLIDAVGAVLPLSHLNQLAAVDGIRSIVANKGIMTSQAPMPDGSDPEGWVTSFRYPVPWDGTPDVEWGRAGDVRLAYPVAIDVGANKFQASKEASDLPLILGRNVGVAIIDSGVYFSDSSKRILGPRAAHAFIGQADFVGHGVCPAAGTAKYQNSIVQRTEHCWTDYYMSKDPYGHGSHVAGTIWNPIWDEDTWANASIAPESRILSVRVLDENGVGTYEDTIQGIQYVVANKAVHGIRVMNMSLSATATVPYFVDPLNRAVESAWAAGIVVVAAAGNMGPQAETITVPGNDPYVITVGAVDGQRTAGYWTDDRLPTWSSTGPTKDGFVKPDVLAPGAQVVSYMYNGGLGSPFTARLVTTHPDFSVTSDFFRMNGTSMATAVTSGMVAMMLEAKPNLTPDQVKFRLMASAKPAIHGDDIGYNLMQQGAGRIWAPDAVLGNFPADGVANVGMNIVADLAHGYATEAELAYHYQGPLRKQLSDDGRSLLYYAQTTDGKIYGFGSTDTDTGTWLSLETLNSRLPTWSGSFGAWGSGLGIWSGGYSHGSGLPTWSGRLPTWSGGMGTSAGGLSWAGGLPTWSGSMTLWSGGMALWSNRLPTWSGGLSWAGGLALWPGGLPTWSGRLPTWSGGQSASVAATRWVEESKDTAMQMPLSESVTVAPSAPAPTAASLHVSDLDGRAQCANKICNWNADVTVTVQDNLSKPVANATVSLLWQTSGEKGNSSCTTNAAGTCSLSQSIKHIRTKVEFMVARISHASLAYTPAANVDMDGDSDGSKISIAQPTQSKSSEKDDQTDDGDRSPIRIFLPAVSSNR